MGSWAGTNRSLRRGGPAGAAAAAGTPHCFIGNSARAEGGGKVLSEQEVNMLCGRIRPRPSQASAAATGVTFRLHPSAPAIRLLASMLTISERRQSAASSIKPGESQPGAPPIPAKVQLVRHPPPNTHQRWRYGSPIAQAGGAEIAPVPRLGSDCGGKHRQRVAARGRALKSRVLLRNRHRDSFVTWRDCRTRPGRA